MCGRILGVVAVLASLAIAAAGFVLPGALRGEFLLYALGPTAGVFALVAILASIHRRCGEAVHAILARIREMDEREAEHREFGPAFEDLCLEARRSPDRVLPLVAEILPHAVGASRDHFFLFANRWRDDPRIREALRAVADDLTHPMATRAGLLLSPHTVPILESEYVHRSSWAPFFAVVGRLLLFGIVAVTVAAIFLPTCCGGEGLARGRAARARALISVMSASLETYQANTGHFPPTDPGEPPGSAALARALREPGPRGQPYITNDAGLFDVTGNFVNPVWGSGAGWIHGVIHYRNNEGVPNAFAPPPSTAHPGGPIHAGGYDLWGTGPNQADVSILNNWGG